jgi:DNA-binding transcriptional LysR family regulator
VARIQSGELGHLRVGFVASATLELVPVITLAFRKRYPGISLELKNMPTVQQVEALRAGSLDAGFVRMPLNAPDLALALVHREPFAMVLSQSHPLARKKDLTVKDLAPQPFIAYGRRWAPDFYDHWTGICLRAGFQPTVVQETAEMATALALVAAGLGVAILPEGMTNRNRRVLRTKSLQREKVYSEIGIATRREAQTPVLRHLMATAKEFIRR